MARTLSLDPRQLAHLNGRQRAWAGLALVGVVCAAAFMLTGGILERNRLDGLATCTDGATTDCLRVESGEIDIRRSSKGLVYFTPSGSDDAERIDLGGRLSTSERAILANSSTTALYEGDELVGFEGTYREETDRAYEGGLLGGGPLMVGGAIIGVVIAVVGAVGARRAA